MIWIVFYAQEPRFLSSVNLSNLVLQTSAVGLVSIGIVHVLLLGEIDLSVGAVSGLCASIMAVLNVQHGWSPYLAIAAAVLAGTAIGLFQGSVFTRFVVPSFVVTLAGLLAWPGFQLKVLGETGTVNLNDPKITGLTNTFYSDTVGWIIAFVAIGVYAVLALRGRQSRVAEGLAAPQLGLVVLRVALVSVAVLVAVWVLNDDRGVPLAALILVGFCLFFFYITTRTTFGRHIFAVGGNAEAARRAGINVTRVRVIVFVISSTMAAVGGIMAASRLLAVNQSSGAGDFLLLAIAGPVIAGTSLFGGRGSVWHALLGALVITSISNGMDLLGLESSIKFIVTGAVLLAGRHYRRDRAQPETGGGTGLTPASGSEPLRVGLIGYGLAGSAFHAPLVEAVPGLSLASVVTSNEERAAQARSTYPHVQVLPSADDLFGASDAHDLVVVAAPNRHHVPLALAAVERRAPRGRRQAARRRASRRRSGWPRRPRRAAWWRASSTTAAGTATSSRFGGSLSEGALGELVRFESRFERWRPEVEVDRWREHGGPEDAGGVLFDLGPHVIDQALELLGPARSVYAEVRTLREGAEVDDDFFLALEHSSGARSQLWATMLAAQPGPRLRATGHGRRLREVGARRAGGGRCARARRPSDPGFGVEPPEAWGLLGSEENAAPVETEPGRYVEFYERMERAIPRRAKPARPSRSRRASPRCA